MSKLATSASPPVTPTTSTTPQLLSTVIPTSSERKTKSSSSFSSLVSDSALAPATISTASPQYKTIYVTTTAQVVNRAGSSDLQAGAIAGIAIGGVAALTLIIGLVFLLLRHRRQRAVQSPEAPRSSGSMTTIVNDKDRPPTAGVYRASDKHVFEVSSRSVYEMEASVPELDGRMSSLDSLSDPKTANMIASRNIMSRGRPVKGAKG